MTTKYSVQPPTKHQGKGITTNFFIRIEEGVFRGIEYTYTQVAHRGIDREDNMKIHFDYDVLYSPLKEVLQKDFEAVIWEILKEIILESVESIDPPPPELEEIDELETKHIEFVPEEIIDFQKPESD